MTNPEFWDYLAGQNQLDFRASGTKGSCIEARELIISLPEEFQKYDREELLKLFVMKFRAKYGTEVIAALHHNKTMTNYHIHLIFSERKPMEYTEVKKATRNMFFNEKGKHVRTKKEILDENGEVRKGCFIVRKGETYDIRYFQPKEPIFKSKAFTAGVKEMYTEFINQLVEEEKDRLTVFDHDGPYLATKKIGKNNPKEAEIRADNAARQAWNQTVDEALTAGVPESRILQVKSEAIQKPIRESVQKEGFHPERLGAILQKAVAMLFLLIRAIPKKIVKTPEFDAEVFHAMVAVRKQLEQQNGLIASKRRKVEYVQERAEELSRPQNLFKRRQKIQNAKELAKALSEYERAAQEPDKIVKGAGYRNVAAFTRAYEKACRYLREEQRKDTSAGRVAGTAPDAQKKKSIIAWLNECDREAKIHPQAAKQRKKARAEERT